MEPDKSLWLIPPESYQESLFHEVHSGIFGAHLKDAKIHGELSKHYWWPKMRADICKWCCSCLVCVRGEAIMLVKLSIIFSNSHNFTYYAHRFYLLFSKLCLV